MQVKGSLLELVRYLWWCKFTDSAIWRQEVTRIIDLQIKLSCMPDWTVWFPKTIRKQINHLEHNIIGKHIWQNWKSIIGKYFISRSCSSPQVDTELGLQILNSTLHRLIPAAAGTIAPCHHGAKCNQIYQWETSTIKSWNFSF